jgi:predicted DNA-binding transcriptional regulator YafY
MVAAPAPTRSWTNGPDLSGKRRLVADRFRRIWAMVEDIAETPGKSRRELADTFHLSERQVQADLMMIRTDMRLPLVRRQGYRFVAEGPANGAGTFDLREAQLLVMILRQSMKDRSIPSDRLHSMMAKLPGMFSPHLQPLVDRTLEAVTAARSSQQQQVFAVLADGLLRGAYVKLHYPPGDMSSPIPDPIVRPELLLPYLSSWYVVGEHRSGNPGFERIRSLMLPLDAVTAVTLAEAPR